MWKKLSGLLSRLHTAKVFFKHRLFRSKYGPSLPDPKKLITINPSKIRYRVVPYFQRFIPYSHLTYFYDGQWDLRSIPSDYIYPHDFLRHGWESRWGDDKQIFPKEFPDDITLVPINQYDLYISYKNHFINNVSWDNTIFYHRRIKEGFKTSRYDSEEGLQRRLSYIDDLYENMKTHGYQTQQQLASNGEENAKDWRHEVQINIGRNGRPILDDGRNRLIIAKLLDIDQIPVRVIVRHKQWQDLRTHIYDNGLRENRENLRNHPDLQDVLRPD